MPNTSEIGLTEIGNGVYAYVQPNTPTSWGWSNAGLITSGPTSLLVDTLYTLAQTQEMLDAMRAAVPTAASIDVLVNSHSDPDHTFGNQLVGGAQIIATKNAAEDMRVNLTPDDVRGIVANTDELGIAGQFFARLCAPFDFSGIELVLPTETFTGRKTVQVGEKTVGAHRPRARAHARAISSYSFPRTASSSSATFCSAVPTPCYGPAPCPTGPAPAMSSSSSMPTSWLPGTAAQRQGRLARVPRLPGLRRNRDDSDAFRGLGVKQAARTIDLSAYAHWLDRERIVLAIDTIYNGLEGNTDAPDYLRLFGEMAEYVEESSRA